MADGVRIYVFGISGRIKHTAIAFLILFIILCFFTVSPLDLSLVKVFYEAEHVLQEWGSGPCYVLDVTADGDAYVSMDRDDNGVEAIFDVQNIYKFTGNDLTVGGTYTCMFDPDLDDEDEGGDDSATASTVVIQDWVEQAKNGYIIAFFALPYLFILAPLFITVVLACVSLLKKRPEEHSEIRKALQPYSFQFMAFGTRIWRMARLKSQTSDAMVRMPLSSASHATDVIDGLELLGQKDPLFEGTMLEYFAMRPHPQVYLMEDEHQGLARERVLKVYRSGGIFGWSMFWLTCLLSLPVVLVAFLACVSSVVYFLPSVAVISAFYCAHFLLYPFILAFLVLLDYILARNYSYLVETTHRDISCGAKVAFGDPFYEVFEVASTNMRGSESVEKERPQSSYEVQFLGEDDDEEDDPFGL